MLLACRILRRLLRRLGSASLLVGAAMLLTPSLAFSAPGDLDPTFGNGGIVVTALRPYDPLDFAEAVTVLPDGRIVVAGSSCDADSSDPAICNAFVAAYLDDGSLDPVFGAGGIAYIPRASVSMTGAAVAVQPGRGIIFGARPSRRSSATTAICGPSSWHASASTAPSI